MISCVLLGMRMRPATTFGRNTMVVVLVNAARPARDVVVVPNIAIRRAKLTCLRMPGPLYLKRRRATGTLEVADRIVPMPGVHASGNELDTALLVAAHVAFNR